MLKLKKNLYGQKQGSRVWFIHLCDKILVLGYKQSKFDECIFYKGDLIFFFYVDDGIFLYPDKRKVDDAIKELNHANMDLEDQGALADCLGINFAYQHDGSIIMSQPQLIDQIIKDVNLKANSHLLPIPTSATGILQRELHTEPFSTKHTWSYRSIICKLNYLEKGTRADITYATHQCAQFCEDPRSSYGRAVKNLVTYLMKTKNKGIILKPDRTKSLEVFADADFLGNWNIKIAVDDASTEKSRTGYIMYMIATP